MNVKPLLGILLLISVQEVSNQQEYDDDDEEYEDLPPLRCSTTERIKGGRVTYSQEGLEGSVLTYHCGPGKYPFPVSYRVCGADGDWSPMRSSSGRRLSGATCKDVLCPAQLQLDNGDFWPMDQWFGVGVTQSFSCRHGFTLYGSAARNCTPSGDWTGTTPVCDNHAGECSDPGIPPGAHRSGRFYTGEKVIYRCQSGLDLLGSSERVCLKNREWSGSMPRCQGPNMFDSPDAVAKAMAGSLGGLMDVFSADSQKKTAGESTFARSIHVDKDSRVNIYILLDTSGSIKEDDFKQSVQATIALIEKLDSYEVKLKFHVLSFASKVIDIVNITDEVISTSANNVIGSLLEFDHKSHKRQTGTNLYAALYRVYEMINLFKQHSKKNHFSQTQNVIIIETDGYSNTGNKPQAALTRIRHLLGYNTSSHDHSDEALLDVYVFGVGDQVNKAELNSLASNKRGEAHLFVIKSFPTLGHVFNSIISDKSVTMCGIAQEATKKLPVFTEPWHVTLRKANLKDPLCSGSIVSEHWVLTAAHCFGRVATKNVSFQVDVITGDVTVPSSRVIMHPNYNVDALKHRHVPEFYDYDVALVWLNKSIPLSWKARPICLPCTIPADRALKKVNSTCQEHRKALIPHTETSVFFMNKIKERKQTHIHTESERPACVEKARQTLNGSDVPLDEYVPDRFLCSAGSKSYRDAISCKGDSGGSLFLQNRNRYFQVGVLSWGTTDVCKAMSSKGYSSDRPPPDARDFHIDLFKILPWLKQHLGEDIKFLPDIK
ncbi:complement C2 [Betta splendens]|uniref:C3/C5 convertase n=1 Tax=Betta splendens TaxID=158456 RepID=A0A6P7P1W1_BETSP|nr:complement C2 [Betta splendens]